MRRIIIPVLVALPALVAVPDAAAVREAVTLQQVLAEPDNAPLNYRYAVSQIARGELLSALSALERVIAAAPGNYEAMLVHALVLYRLENLDEASRELEVLERLPLSAGLRREIRGLQRTIGRRLSRFQLGGQLGAGFERDSNRKATPSSGQVRLFDNLITLNREPHKADENLVLFGTLTGRQDLGSQRGHDVSESFTYYRTQQEHVKDLDLDAYSFKVSGRYRAAPADLVASLNYDYLLLDREKYLNGRGAGLRLERQFRRTGLYLDGKYFRQAFTHNSAASGASDRNGGQSEFSFGSDYQLNPSMKINLEYGYALRHAKEDIYNFKRNSLRASHVWFLGGGTFLESAVTCSLDRYPRRNTFVSRKRRDDTLLKASMTYGLPLGGLSRHLESLLSSFTAEIQDSRSTITNYIYRNYKFGAMISYRWQLGF